MKHTRNFAHSPGSVPEARQFATEALQDAPPETLDVIALMVSELASNCVRHTDSEFEVTVRSSGEEIRVEAIDRGEGEPRMRPAGPDDLSGRGLQIVDMFSTDWGVESLPGSGKVVWFTLTVSEPAQTASG